VTWKIRWIGKDNIDRQKAEKSNRKDWTQRCVEDHAGAQNRWRINHMTQRKSEEWKECRHRRLGEK